MLAKIASNALSMRAAQSSKPKEIHVQSDRLIPFLLKMTSSFGIKLELKLELNILNLAKNELNDYVQ